MSTKIGQKYDHIVKNTKYYYPLALFMGRGGSKKTSWDGQANKKTLVYLIIRDYIIRECNLATASNLSSSFPGAKQNLMLKTTLRLIVS